MHLVLIMNKMNLNIKFILIKIVKEIFCQIQIKLLNAKQLDQPVYFKSMVIQQTELVMILK